MKNTNHYTLRYRPASAVTLPPRLAWRFIAVGKRDHVLQQARPELPLTDHPFGIIETYRPLTPEEMETFQIVKV